MIHNLAWTTIELIGNFVDSYLLLRLVTSSLQMKWNKRRLWLVYTFIFACLCSVANFFCTSLVQLYIVLTVSLLLFTSFFTSGTYATKLFWTFFTPILFFGVDMLNCDIALRLMPGVPSDIIYQQGSIRLFLMIVTRASLSVIVLWLQKKRLLISSPLSLTFSLLLCPVLSWISLMLLTSLFAKDHISDNYLLLATFLLCSINAVYIYLFLSLRNRDEALRENSLLVQRMESERKHLTSLQEYSSNLEKWKHDAKKHYRAILDLAQKTDDVAVISYVSKISDNIIQLPVPVNTNNTLFDSLVGDYAKEALSKGIAVSLELQVPILKEDFSVDLCSIVGNMWENAIEGCERSSKEQRHIYFSTYQDDFHFIMKMRNTFDSENVNLKGSSKKGPGHGLGLKIIDSVLDSNFGFSSINISEEFYVFQAAVPIETVTDASVERCNLFYWESK